MGRRKIEIKAIKDDRNRSVTFLKRKGGLFKKAHELSVLCSVDVAVIIFGNNKKLYEYSSSDIGEILNRYQFYGGANEHKGPADFNGKKDLDDDDDDDMGTPPPDLRMSQDPQMMPPQYQHQPTNQFQHIRNHTASASPPIPNGMPFHHPQQRQHTPQPHQISRPTSRNDGVRRVSSGLSQHHGMPQVSGPPQGVNGFAYMPNPSIYNPHAAPMPQGMPQQPPPPHQQQQQQHPSYQYPAPPPPQQQHLQQVYMEETRRQSMPPAFPQAERAASIPHRSPPQPQVQIQGPPQQQQQQQQQPETQSKPEQIKQENRHHMLEPIKKATKQSRSIFTPIDEDRSVLSKHWASSTTAAEPLQAEPRSQSVDVGAGSRNANGSIAPPPSPPRTAQAHKKDRNISLSSIDFPPPSRTNSGMSQLGPNAKRPRLKVQIPDEPSDNDSQTAESNNSAQGTNSSHPSRPNAGTDSSQSGGPGSTMGIMTLPPPSPSTSTIQSAGATGPPNPFARPLPPSNTNSSNSNPNQSNNQNAANGNNNNNNANGIRGSSGGLAEIETPVSALPSRFMNNEFLPSPSSFYPEWNFRSGRPGDSAGGMGMELQSPLNFATPVIGSGPSFLRDESRGEKEKDGGGVGKRKSPDGEDARGNDEAKRVKHEV